MAVKAKNDRFFDSARAAISAANTSSASTVPPSARSSSSVAVRAAFSRLEASPACDEWASSAMIAKFLPLRSAWVRISSSAQGKV